MFTRKNRKRALSAAILSVPLALFGLTLASGPAHASAGGFSAQTTISNNTDDGGNGFWSADDFTRTLTVLVASCPAATPAGTDCYTATIADSGTWNGVVGAFTPNQALHPGKKIASSASGMFTGSSSYSFSVPHAHDSASPANVAATLDDNFGKPTTGADSTSSWFLQAFASADQGSVTGSIGNDWTWTYKDAATCESWTDSAGNNDGQAAADGDITGVSQCPPAPPAPVVPVLSNGHAVQVSPHRENVFFDQSVASVDKFTIVGPGPINGHVGWVNAVAGTNAAIYRGLLEGHGYTVRYTPYTAVNGSPIPGASTGYVYFRTA